MPTGRPTASSRSARKTRSSGTSGPLRQAKDTPEGVPVRMTADRLEVVRQSLSDRDREVLHFLQRVRLATGFQIARCLWAAPVPSHGRARAARQALARLEKHRVVERISRRMGGVRGGSTSIVYELGVAGNRLLAEGRRRHRLATPGARYVAHVLDQTELVVQLCEAERDGSLRLLGVEAEPACWRTFAAPFGGTVSLKPDLFTRIAAGERSEDRWFIEVDRATESILTIRSKAERYLAYLASGVEQERHGTFPRVVWTTPDERRRDQLAAALERLPEPGPRLFVAWLFEETVGRLAAEARL
jgi:hypothetical protein